jgi:parallel beta-helix repeat protein
MSENMLSNDGFVVWDSYENLIWSNKVNGKPLTYLESVSNLTVGDSGQVVLVRCSYITVENLNLCNTTVGIQLWETNNTRISRSSITNNDYGIWLWYSLNNSIYHNNFINNTCQILSGHSSNSLDDSYPGGGNFWSDYSGIDGKTGLNQNEYGSDGIGDIPYDIDTGNRDRYPLMGKISYFNATSQNQVQTISNSLISDFQFNGTAIIFNVTGEEGTVGFCRILVPTVLINATYHVFANLTEVSYTILPFSNSTHSILYFTYNHSTQEVIVVTEFPSIMFLQLSMVLAMLVIVSAKRKTPIRRAHMGENAENHE